MKFVGYVVLCVVGLKANLTTADTDECPVDFVNTIATTGTCLYISSTARDWFSAREGCVSLGANLVHVVSQTVADECKKLSEDKVIQNYWIGVTDLLTDQDYRWTDGAPMTWSNWGAHNAHVQPNDNDQSQGCIIADLDANMLVSNTWQDKRCSDHYHYICEYMPGEKSFKVGLYRLREGSITSLVNVEVTSTTDCQYRPRCAGICLREDICDGYAFNQDTTTCFLLKLKEVTGSEQSAIQSQLTGSDVYTRSG